MMKLKTIVCAATMILLLQVPLVYSQGSPEVVQDVQPDVESIRSKPNCQCNNGRCICTRTRTRFRFHISGEGEDQTTAEPPTTSFATSPPSPPPTTPATAATAVVMVTAVANAGGSGSMANAQSLAVANVGGQQQFVPPQVNNNNNNQGGSGGWWNFGFPGFTNMNGIQNWVPGFGGQSSSFTNTNFNPGQRQQSSNVVFSSGMQPQIAQQGSASGVAMSFSGFPGQQQQQWPQFGTFGSAMAVAG